MPEEIILTAKEKKELAMTPAQKIERSIIKKFKKEIWRKFTGAINDYKMICDGDCIAVVVDEDIRSALLAKEFAEISKHGVQNFTYEVIVTDLTDIKMMELLDIPVMHRCAKKDVISIAKSLHCNKITEACDFDDVIETIVYHMLYEAKVETIMPLEEQNGLTIIRPLYLTTAADLEHWVTYNDIPSQIPQDETKKEVRALIAELTKENKYVPMNIFRSVENVNLATLIAYVQNQEKHCFLDEYDTNKYEVQED